jgi:hypothetical protein
MCDFCFGYRPDAIVEVQRMGRYVPALDTRSIANRRHPAMSRSA